MVGAKQRIAESKKVAETNKPATAERVSETRRAAQASETQTADCAQAVASPKAEKAQRGLANNKVDANNKAAANDDKPKAQSEAERRAGEAAKARTARLNKDFDAAYKKDPTVAKGLPPGQKPDFRSHRSEFPKNASSLPGDNKALRVQTNGPISVKRSTGTLGLEGSKYTVSWQPLGPDGRIQTSVSSGKPPERGGHFLGPGSTTSTHAPPYHNKHGWIATVKPVPHPAVNANSLGVFHSVQGS